MTTATELLSPQEAASRLGVSPNTLETWRTRRRYRLAYIKVGGRVRYTQAAIEAFLKSRTITPGESYKKGRKTQ